MPRYRMNALLLLAALALNAKGYWLMGIENFITTERLDPIVSPGKVSGHAHSVLGGSNFRMTTNTASLRESECTSVPIPQDKSNYWFPHLYFQWENGSFTSLDGGAVIYYLFSEKLGTTTAFPDDFRMLSGDPALRTYDSNSHAQQAVTFLCLDFGGTSTRHNSLPAKACPSGIRSQINFPSCWDGKNLDSPDHKSHVAFLSNGPDKGTCSDPKYPIILPRIFLEVYWASNSFDNVRTQAKDSAQPFVFSNGDPTGYGYHADFLNGWDKGVLQNAVDKCHCNQYGDFACCVDQHIFDMKKTGQCHITKTVDEPTLGTLTKLPGNNPVQKEGVRATTFTDPNAPTLLAPVYAYTGDAPPAVGKPGLPAPPTGAASSTALIISSAASSPSASSKQDTANPVEQLIVPSHPALPVDAAPISATGSSLPHTSNTSSHANPLPHEGSPSSSTDSSAHTGPKCKHERSKARRRLPRYAHALHKKSKRLMKSRNWSF